MAESGRIGSELLTYLALFPFFVLVASGIVDYWRNASFLASTRAELEAKKASLSFTSWRLPLYEWLTCWYCETPWVGGVLTLLYLGAPLVDWIGYVFLLLIGTFGLARAVYLLDAILPAQARFDRKEHTKIGRNMSAESALMQLDRARETLGNWSAMQQGHDACWYYPEVFEKLASDLNVVLEVAHAFPPEAEFEAGCKRYRQELYGLDAPDEKIITEGLDVSIRPAPATAPADWDRHVPPGGTPPVS